MSGGCTNSFETNLFRDYETYHYAPLSHVHVSTYCTTDLRLCTLASCAQVCVYDHIGGHTTYTLYPCACRTLAYLSPCPGLSESTIFCLKFEPCHDYTQAVKVVPITTILYGLHNNGISPYTSLKKIRVKR